LSGIFAALRQPIEKWKCQRKQQPEKARLKALPDIGSLLGVVKSSRSSAQQYGDATKADLSD
jgi:hypothetical protein